MTGVFLFLEWSQTPYISPLLLHQLLSLHLMHINRKDLIYFSLSIGCSLSDDVLWAWHSQGVSYKVYFMFLFFKAAREHSCWTQSPLLSPCMQMNTSSWQMKAGAVIWVVIWQRTTNPGWTTTAVLPCNPALLFSPYVRCWDEREACLCYKANLKDYHLFY